MNENITLLASKKPDEQRAAIERLKREMGNMIEAAAVIAKIRRISFEAYVKEGFTPEQALALCMK